MATIMKTKNNPENPTTPPQANVASKKGLRHRSPDECPVMRALDLIANKWTVPVIYNLYCAGGPVRFGQLQKRIETITQKELTKRLRGLERAGLIERRVYAEVPPRVEYRLTEIGTTLVEPLRALSEWATKYSAVLDAHRQQHSSAIPPAQTAAAARA